MFQIGVILAVLKHSGKIPSDNELLKSIGTVVKIRGAKIWSLITGILIRSVYFFFCLLIRLTLSLHSEGGRGAGANRKLKGKILE